MVPERCRQTIRQPETTDHGQRIGKDTLVRRCRAGGDHADVITHHVGENQAHHIRGRGCSGQLSALHGGKVLAHAVDRPNVGTTLHQQLIGRRQFVQGRVVRQISHQRRRPARQQTEHQIICARLPRKGQHPARGLHSCRVGQGMTRLGEGDPLQRQTVPILGDHMAVRDERPQNLLRSFGHQRRRLARRQQVERTRQRHVTPGDHQPIRLTLELRTDQGVRQNLLHAGQEDLFSTKSHGFRVSLLCSAFGVHIA